MHGLGASQIAVRNAFNTWAINHPLLSFDEARVLTQTICPTPPLRLQCIFTPLHVCMANCNTSVADSTAAQLYGWYSHVRLTLDSCQATMGCIADVGR